MKNNPVILSNENQFLKAILSRGCVIIRNETLYKKAPFQLVGEYNELTFYVKFLYRITIINYDKDIVRKYHFVSFRAKKFVSTNFEVEESCRFA